MSGKEDRPDRASVGCNPVGLAMGFGFLAYALYCLLTSIRW